MSCIQTRRGANVYARLEWGTNETLQLQRLAHEELGVGTWEGCAGDVPVTKRGERLAVLDLGDLDHPRLKAPLAVGDGSEGKEDGGASTEEVSTPDGEAESDAGRVDGSRG